MKKTLIVALTSALALSGSLLVSGARAEMTTTEKTTTYKGTVSEVDPSSSTIIVKSETETTPAKYTYTKETVFTDSQGHVVTYEAMRNTPVTVYYTRDGDRTIVTKVMATQPVAAVEHHETTTTETKHEKY